MSHSDNAPGGGSRAQVLSWVVDREGRILQTQSAPPTVGGAAPPQSVLDHVAPAHQSAVRAALERAFYVGERESQSFQGNPPLRDGAWYLCHITPTLRGGEVVSATLATREISEWKSAERQLTSEWDRMIAELTDPDVVPEHPRPNDQSLLTARLIRRVLDAAGEAVFVVDADTEQIADVNQTACRWLRSSRDELISRRVGDLRVGFPLRLTEHAVRSLTETRGAHRPDRYREGVVQRSDGTSFPVEVALVKHAVGERVYVIAVVRDIKQRGSMEDHLREYRERYRGLFELSRDAIYLCARDGTITDANEAAAQLLGYTRAELCGRNTSSLYRESDQLARFQLEVAGAEAVRDFVVDLVEKDGTPIPALLSATVRRGPGGGIVGYQCMVRRRGQPGGSSFPDSHDSPSPSGPRRETRPRVSRPAGPPDPPAGALRHTPLQAPRRMRRRTARSVLARPRPRAVPRQHSVVLHTVASALVRLAETPRFALPPLPRTQPAPLNARPRQANPYAARATRQATLGIEERAPAWRAAPGRPRAERVGSVHHAASSMAHHHAWAAVGGIGATLAAIGWADLAILWLPFDFDRPEWVFATVGAHFHRLLIGTLGLVLLALAAVHHGWRRVARTLATAFPLLAVGLVALYCIYFLSAPLAWVSAAPQLSETVDRVFGRVSALAGGYVVVYAVLGVYLARRADELPW